MKKRIWIYLLLSSVAIGCATKTGWFTNAPTTMPTEAITAPVSSCSPMLSWLGGLCTLCGMALLVLTGGRMGWRPLIGGVLFVVLNYVLALYASWIFLPVVISTSAISLAWPGKIVCKIVNDDDIQ